MNSKPNGFVLIEFLIVLAVIAVPNFLAAQIRSKVSRVKTDFRTLATGLEAYHVDHNHYPAWKVKGERINPTSTRLIPLTTPD